MDRPRVLLIFGFFVCWQLNSFAEQGLQSRFEKSVKDLKAISTLEASWLDTMSIEDPEALKSINVRKGVFSRTFQYSYLASGRKYRATCKLISATETNIVPLFESAFDGQRYSTYSGQDSRMTTRSGNGPGDDGEDPNSPLIAPFMFLTGFSDRCLQCVLRPGDIVARVEATKPSLPTAEASGGLLEVTIPGQFLGRQQTTWKVAIDETGDSFTPKVIKFIDPGQKLEVVNRLLDYTNIGTYQFPSRIEWSMSSYPPTSPATLISTGTVTLISARIPDQLADSIFNLDNDEKTAVAVWDWDHRKFVKSPPHVPRRIASRTARNGVVLLILLTTVAAPVLLLVAKKTARQAKLG